MKKLISGVFLYPGRVGGAENYFYNLLSGIKKLGRQDEFKITINETVPVSAEELQDFETIKKNIRINRGISDYFPNLFFGKIKSHLYFSPNYITPFFKFKNTKTITVIHDLQYKHFPHFFSRKKRIWLYVSILNTLNKADKVVCISNFVREDIESHFGKKYSNKLTVIPNPIDLNRFNFEEEPMDLIGSKKYILSVCAHYPHKNLLTLINAFKEFHKTHSDYELILVGQLSKNLVSSNSSYGQELTESIENNSFIKVTGYLSDPQLGSMYHNCSFFVFPSSFEGFGMPPVEAMCFGKPVITCDVTSLKEVTLGKAIYIKDPSNSNEFLLRMVEVADDIDSYSAKFNSYKKQVIDTYSPEVIAKQYLDVFDELSD